VNAVGVDVNSASVPLLARVSGVGPTLAENIVVHRDAHGAFPDRRALTKVPRLGPKAFEQCAGFLRVQGGTDPLDRSGVHPEAYPVVRRIAASVGGEVGSLLGSSVLRTLDPAAFVDGVFGLPTVTDILAELEKPGRDPRPTFRTATFADGVEKIADLRPGMVLEGIVTNVAAFGAFVDVGVHQDGLVHVSAMSRSFVRDPRDVVKSGDVVRVKVTVVDVARNRIGLTLRLDGEAGSGGGPRRGPGDRAAGDRAAGDRGGGDRAGGDRAGGDRAGGDRGRGDRAGGDREAHGDRGGGRSSRGDERSGGGDRGGRGGGDRRGGRPDQARGPRPGGGGGRSQPEPTGAMADALRRAGLDPSEPPDRDSRR
jgi:uncharacterized protein